MQERISKLPNHHETGFYWHYKHDVQRGIFDHAYLILGLGIHTEYEIDPQNQIMQVYYPLDPESFVYCLGKAADLRPNAMAMEDVEVDGNEKPRFTRVTDPELIGSFKKRLQEMYPEITECFTT